MRLPSFCTLQQRSGIRFRGLGVGDDLFLCRRRAVLGPALNAIRDSCTKLSEKFGKATAGIIVCWLSIIGNKPAEKERRSNKETFSEADEIMKAEKKC